MNAPVVAAAPPKLAMLAPRAGSARPPVTPTSVAPTTAAAPILRFRNSPRRFFSICSSSVSSARLLEIALSDTSSAICSPKSSRHSWSIWSWCATRIRHQCVRLSWRRSPKLEFVPMSRMLCAKSSPNARSRASCVARSVQTAASGSGSASLCPRGRMPSTISSESRTNTVITFLAKVLNQTLSSMDTPGFRSRFSATATVRPARAMRRPSSCSGSQPTLTTRRCRPPASPQVAGAAAVASSPAPLAPSPGAGPTAGRGSASKVSTFRFASASATKSSVATLASPPAPGACGGGVASKPTRSSSSPLGAALPRSA
mmetsp:Transcript_13503/g.38235  ORF Transcript_13503/g.38235 Transcript_13503/m.38235 type:complete len:315 (+) Transcript_13503:1133-2077(+)